MSRHRLLVGLRLLLTWAAVWPVVMLGAIVVELLAPDLPFMVRTFFMTGGMVPMIALVIAPLVSRIVAWAARRTSGA